MWVRIFSYPDRFDPGATAEMSGWPSLVQVSPLDGSGRVSIDLWRANAAYKPGADPVGSEEFAPGAGLPTLAEMMADPAFAVPWTLLGHYLLSRSAERFAGATVETTEAEAAVLAAFSKFLESMGA